MYHVKNINGNRNGKESLFGAERTFNPFQGLGKHISFRRWTRDDRTDNNPSLISSYKAYKKMVELFGTYKEDTTRNFYGTILFNNWLDYCKVYTKSETTTYGSHRGGYTRTLTYAISFVDGVLTLKGTIPGNNTKLMTQAIIENWTSIIVRLPCVQMESQQGNTDQDSDKASNTVITRDQGQTRSVELGIQNLTLREICSTEPEYTFDQIVNRWMPLPVIAITINQIFNTLVKTYKLPSFLYSESGAPNIMPFKNFVYGSYVIEFKFVVNANKFHVGKVIAAVKYDSYQINAIRNDVTTMLCRPHVILDLAANNEGILSVPFKYHRTYVRNTALATSSYGTHVAEYASVDLAILSSLGSVAGGPTTMNITPFYRIVKAHYTGMNTAYAVAQMEGVILEEGLKFAGKILNCDKPVDLVHQAQYVPKPRMNFSSGKGASDAIPMRNDPSTMTTFMAEHRYPEDPKTVLDIARVWGLIGSFDWSMSQTTGSLLYQQPIDPTWRTATDWTGVPTPLEYISSMFQFWSGPLEIRLDFVSNAFHTGAIMISAEYGRETPDLTSCASTYTKTFHLGEQKTVTCVIPYIFDTVWRRTQTVPFCPIKTAEPAGGMYGQVALLRTMSSRFSIRVVNELVPIASVPSNIQVLIYIRAGEQFTLHSPIMSNMFNTEQSFLLDSFPGNYPLSATTTATFVNPEGRTGKEVRRLIKAHKWDEHSHKDSSHKYAQYLSKKARYAANVTSTKASSINRVEALLSPARDFEVGGRKFDVDFEKGIFREAGYATPHYVHGFVDTSDPNLSVYDLFDQAIRNYNIMEPVPKGPPLPKGKSYASSYGVPPQTKEYPDITYPDEDVKPQMDNGEKEDQDNTASFRQGPPRHNIQTVDSHINIKDIMRRPLCIMDNVTVNAFEGTNYFMIPCMVPSHMMVPTESGFNGIYSPAIGRSPQVHIADLFRFARGSHRYTIVLESSSNAPIYISYIPHSGARVVGNITYGNVIGNFASLGAFGLQTEMLLPSVNPSITIETPFDMEENWNLVFDSNAALNYSWRDKGDTNIGHLVITSRVSVTISVWWAAGDDFELSNFLGVPPCISGMSKFFYTDNYPMPSIQMESEDFPPKSKLDGSLFGIKAKNWLFGGAAAMVSTIPVVGPAVSTSMAASRATEFLNNIEDQAQGVTHNLTTTCENASRNLDTMTSEVSEAVIALTSKIEEAVATLVKTCTWAKDVSRVVLDTICDVVLVLYNQNWATLGISLARLLSNMLGVNLAKVISHLGDLPKIITDYFNSNTQQLESLPEAQVEGASNEFISDGFWTAELLSRIIGIIVGLISVCVGVKNPGVSTTMVSDFLKKFFSLGGLSVMNHAIRFVGTIFDLIKACLLWVCASTSCEVKTIQMLQSQGEAVDKFIEESQILLNPINEIAFNNPAFRLRFWAHTIKARQLQQALAKLPNNQVAPVVMRMCNDIIKKSQEKAADLRCSPIKYEPFVICLEGASGLGKSHMARKLSTDILPDLGVNSYPGDPVYFRMQGSKHWNNYLDQPVVVIDEWGNINDPNVAVEAINEWFQLKSSATFIPEQAAVEEKKTRANPKMVIALCNNAFPKTIIESVAITPEAVYRRRDVLVKVMKNSDVNMRDVKKKAAKTKTTTYDHLSFSFYKNSCDPKSLESTTYTYAEAMAEIKRRAAEYHECEMANVNARIRELQTFSNIPIGDITCDPFAIFYNHVDPIIRQTPATLPSEILEQQVLELRAAMQKTLNPAQVEVEDITEEEVDSIFSTHGQDEVQTQGPILYGFAALAAAAYTHMNVVDRGAKAHCVGCKEIRSCAVACENQHYMCELCAYQYSSCCVCKGKYYMVVSEERGKMYALAQKCLKLLSVGSIVIMKYAMKFLYSAVVVGAVMTINKGVLALGVAGIIWFKYSKLTQVWREVPEREPVIIEVQLPSGSKHFKPHVSVDSVLDCTFNEVAFEEQYGQEVDIMTLDTCIHTLCYEDMANTTYDDGNFQYTTTEAYVALPLGACNETCPWRNKSYRREFCNKWYDTHFNVIKVTLLENARMDLEYAKQRYPHFAIPKWFTQSNKRKTPTIMGYNLPDWFTRTNLCKGLKYALAAISAIVVAYATYKGVGYLLSWVLPGPQAGSIISSGSDRVASYAKRYRPTKVSSFSTGFQDEQVIEAQDELLETVSDKVAKNFFSFIVTNNKTKEVAKILTGLGIKQRMGIIPRHYYKALVHYNSDEYTITIGRFPRNDLAIPYKFSNKDFIVSTYSDIAIVYLPASMNMFKNILHFIVKDSDFQRKHSELGRLVRVPLRNENYFSVLSVDIKGFVESQTMMDTDGVVMLRDVIEYNYSKPGVCGSPLLMENTQRPIYGIHVAGSGTEFTGRGFAVLISQEMFNDVPCDPVSMQAEDMEEPDWVLPLEKVKLHLPEDVNVNPLGVLPKELTPYAPQKSKIKLSLISSELNWKPKKQPCILSKNDPRYKALGYKDSPLVAGCAKHGKLTSDFSTADLNEVRQIRFDQLMAINPLINKPEKLSIEEAITGFPNIQYYDQTNLNTSAGWPYCTTSKTLKNEYCEIERDAEGYPIKVTLSQDVLNRLEKNTGLRKKGQVPFTIFVDSLKDERRPVEKLSKLGGTRIFCSSPFDFTIAMRQSFLHFIAASMAHRLEIGHAIGINLKSSETTRLVRKLLSVGENIVTIDYSNFGPGFNAGVASSAMRNIIEWTQEKVKGTDAKELSCLMHENINSIHCMSHFLYQQKGGSPSGSPITVIINTEVNDLYIKLAWLHLFRKLPNKWQEFFDNVRYFTYGDDLIMSVSDKYIDQFNGVTIQKVFQEYGIVATDATKGAEMIAYTKLKDATFLKHSFEHHPIHDHEWIAKLELDSVKEIPHWIQEPIMLKEATLVNAEAALRESYGHGPVFFEKFKRDINRALSARKLQTLTLSWEDMDKDFYPDYY